MKWIALVTMVMKDSVEEMIFSQSCRALPRRKRPKKEVSLQILAEEWVDKQLLSICRTMWDGMRVRGRVNPWKQLVIAFKSSNAL